MGKSKKPDLLMFITVKAEFGSEFQKKCAVETVAMMMQAWKIHIRNAHKKNKVEVEFK